MLPPTLKTVMPSKRRMKSNVWQRQTVKLFVYVHTTRALCCFASLVVSQRRSSFCVLDGCSLVWWVALCMYVLFARQENTLLCYSLWFAATSLREIDCGNGRVVMID